MGLLGAGETCEIVVNVTADTDCGAEDPEADVLGCFNSSGDLTSSAGNSGNAEDELSVDTDLPGFSKSFSPSTVPLGGRSTVTFTIDNSLNGALVANLDFTDNLLDQVGVVVTPGIGYGSHGEGYVRLSLTITDAALVKGLSRLSGWRNTRRLTPKR